MNRVRKNFGSYSRIISEIYRDQKIRSRAEVKKDSIEIDLSRLDVIRSDAAVTRERLMTEEERYIPARSEDLASGPDRSEQKTDALVQDEKAADRSDGYGFEDELWRMFDEYSEEDSSDTDQFS